MTAGQRVTHLPSGQRGKVTRVRGSVAMVRIRTRVGVPGEDVMRRCPLSSLEAVR